GIVSASHKNTNSKIIAPCFIGENVQLIDSVVGPHVSIGNNSIIENSVVKNSIIQTNSKIKNSDISNSMVGNYSEYTGKSSDLSLGDYSTIR
ncbi:MAG TPA: nucleotidyltransferase, partial [Bacteroidia bacterium]|nr:nucleotidyltransferase [Bacteroidia bacterium]